MSNTIDVVITDCNVVQSIVKEVSDRLATQIKIEAEDEEAGKDLNEVVTRCTTDESIADDTESMRMKSTLQISSSFMHPHYHLVDGNKIVRNNNAPAGSITIKEGKSIISSVVRFVEDKIINDLNFEHIYIPDESAQIRTSILASSDWETNEKLLIIMNSNDCKESCLFSRSYCLDFGLDKGTILPYVEKAISKGYAVMILRPDTNSIKVEDLSECIFLNSDSRNSNNEDNSFIKKVSYNSTDAPGLIFQDFSDDITSEEIITDSSDGNASPVIITGVKRKIPKRIYIEGSETPEIHVIGVWDSIISKTEGVVKHIALLGFGRGVGLCKEVFIRQMVKSKTSGEDFKIFAFAAVEASEMIEDTDSIDIKKLLNNMAINFESSHKEFGSMLPTRQSKLGILSISLGIPTRISNPIESSGKAILNDIDGGEMIFNVADSYNRAIDAVFQYLEVAEINSQKNDNCEVGKGNTSNNRPLERRASLSKLFYDKIAIVEKPDELKELNISKHVDIKRKKSGTWNSLKSFFGGGPKSVRHQSVEGVTSLVKTINQSLYVNVEVSDFDLLKVVGKGAFGKVMLVRKKNTIGNDIYAMKILLKSKLTEEGQMENTMTERDILHSIKHPYIVRLRFAFQNDTKLYLVTDYYSGGTLFVHLKAAKKFDLDRAKFYGAELVSAISHLHSQHIVYRDLKLENILMDYQGHIALTDFGLSRKDIDKSGGATTFCGTAEYIAPEILTGKQYGPSVDWWGFGVLLYEMIFGKTPFYNKNRKLMFYRIMNVTPSFSDDFSEDAKSICKGLMNPNPSDRLGSGETGSMEVLNHPFFSTIDFHALYRKEIIPTYVPNIDAIDENSNRNSYDSAEENNEGRMISTDIIFNENRYLGAVEGFTFNEKGLLGDNQNN